MKFFKHRWEELRGDEYDNWGASTWYFETGDDFWPTRQIEMYDNGNALLYDQQHDDDDYGGLSEVALFADDFAPFEITQQEFEQAWNNAKPVNR